MLTQSKFVSSPSWKRWNRQGYSVFASINRYFTLGTLAVTMSIVAKAGENSSEMIVDTDSVTGMVMLRDVGVTGRQASATRHLVSQTPVFSRTTDAAAPLQTFESALRLSPAVDVRERGSKSIQSDICIRGGSFDQSLVMLNGINFSDARTGHQSHSLPVGMDIVSSINVIDGVAGIGSYAGAVDIRTSPIYPRYLRAEAVGGMHGYANGSVSAGVTTDNLSSVFSSSVRHSNGYKHNTGFTDYNAYGRVMYEDAGTGIFDVQAGYQNRRFGANGFYSRAFPDQYEHTSTALASLRWSRNISKLTLNAYASYRYNTDRFELVKGVPEVVPYNYHITHNTGAGVSTAYEWLYGETTIEADMTNHNIYSTVLGDVCTPRVIGGIAYNHHKSRTLLNATLRHSVRCQALSASASVGLGHSEYGTDVLWSVTANYALTPDIRLTASAVESMRLPTFTDLYYTAKGYESDRNLKPEHATTGALGIVYDHGNWHGSVYAYDRYGRNVIDWVKDTPESNWRSMQLTRVNTTGTELMVSYTQSGILQRIGLTYGYVHQHSSSKQDIISNIVFDHLRNKTSVAVDLCPIKRLTLSMTGTLYDRAGLYAGADGVNHEYKPYVLVDARLAYTMGIVKLYADATNLTGTVYHDFGGLEMPRCWVTGGLVLTLK